MLKSLTKQRFHNSGNLNIGKYQRACLQSSLKRRYQYDFRVQIFQFLACLCALHEEVDTSNLPFWDRWQSICLGLQMTPLTNQGSFMKRSQSKGRLRSLLQACAASFLVDYPCLMKNKSGCVPFYIIKEQLNPHELQQKTVNRSMSVTISTCQQICHAPTNSSSAKALYSFPKQQRFLKRKKLLCDRFYEPKNARSTRAAGFGYGTKYDFTKQLPNSPPPNSYNLVEEKQAKGGFSFGESRDKMMLTGPLANAIQNKNPGPGNYEAKNERSKISYSLAARIKHEDKEQIAVPGPGQYSSSFSISRNGSYFLAKHKSSCVRDFGKVLGRCNTLQANSPGPCAYDISAHQDISPDGKYALAKSTNCLSRSFGHSQQRGDVALNRYTPGPGNYKLPSDFGHYLSKKAAFKENRIPFEGDAKV